MIILRSRTSIRSSMIRAGVGSSVVRTKARTRAEATSRCLIDGNVLENGCVLSGVEAEDDVVVVETALILLALVWVSVARVAIVRQRHLKVIFGHQHEAISRRHQAATEVERASVGWAGQPHPLHMLYSHHTIPQMERTEPPHHLPIGRCRVRVLARPRSRAFRATATSATTRTSGAVRLNTTLSTCFSGS